MLVTHFHNAPSWLCHFGGQAVAWNGVGMPMKALDNVMKNYFIKNKIKTQSFIKKKFKMEQLSSHRLQLDRIID